MTLDLMGPTLSAVADRGKPRALAISAGLHVASFLALMYAPPLSLPTLPSASPSEYQQAFAGKEDKIVWYKFHDLPDVAPQNSAEAHGPIRAAKRAKQAIVSSPKNAPARDQVVVTEAPEIDLQNPDLPNLIAVKLPPKQFTTPPDLVRPEPPKIEIPDVPEMQAEKMESANLPATRLPARAFVPPPAAPKPAQTAVMIDTPVDAPKIEEPNEALKLNGKLPAMRLPARAYVPPPPQKAPELRKIVASAETPPIAANAPTAATMPSVKLPSRAYAPPPPAAETPKKNVAPPPIDGPAGDVTIAIAGLNPATTAVKLPAASSPAQFSAGLTVRPDGATSDGTSKGITAPDLYAHAATDANEANDAKGKAASDLLAMTFAAPTSKAFLDDMARRRPPDSTTLSAAPSATSTVAPRASATKVSNAPDARFNGRDVYMMTIQMPNLTSYSGHWLMWYAAQSGLQSDLSQIAAPVPQRKVDPRYIASAVDEHVEGRVQLFCVIGREGKVGSIEVIRGADERLNRSAEEALAKWEFSPATRNGQPVDVDVVVEIPFVLGPPRLK